MSLIMLRVIDSDFVGDGKKKAGDIVTIQPDTHEFSMFERTNPIWRVVRVSLLPSEEDFLQMSEFDISGKLKERRKNKVHFKQLANKDWFINENPTGEILDIPRSTFLSSIKEGDV